MMALGLFPYSQKALLEIYKGMEYDDLTNFGGYPTVKEIIQKFCDAYEIGFDESKTKNEMIDMVLKAVEDHDQ